MPGIALLRLDVIGDDGTIQRRPVRARGCNGAERVSPSADEARHLPDGLAAGQGPRRGSDFQGHDSGSAGLSRMSGAPRSGRRSASHCHDRTADRAATMAVDIACVGFGPAMGGFLTTLSRSLLNPDGSARLESATSARPAAAGDLLRARGRAGLRSFSGAVTRARGIRGSFPDLDLTQIPMVGGGEEREARIPARSRRRQPPFVRLKARRPACCAHSARCFGLKRRCVRAALHAALSCRNTTAWCCRLGSSTSGSAITVAWPSGWCRSGRACPSPNPFSIDDAVAGVRLADQGTDLHGRPEAGFTARHGPARCADGRGRWSGGRGRPQDRRAHRNCRRAMSRANGRWA